MSDKPPSPKKQKIDETSEDEPKTKVGFKQLFKDFAAALSGTDGISDSVLESFAEKFEHEVNEKIDVRVKEVKESFKKLETEVQQKLDNTSANLQRQLGAKSNQAIGRFQTSQHSSGSFQSLQNVQNYGHNLSKDGNKDENGKPMDDNSVAMRAFNTEITDMPPPSGSCYVFRGGSKRKKDQMTTFLCRGALVCRFCDFRKRPFVKTKERNRQILGAKQLQEGIKSGKDLSETWSTIRELKQLRIVCEGECLANKRLSPLEEVGCSFKFRARRLADGETPSLCEYITGHRHHSHPPLQSIHLIQEDKTAVANQST